MDLLRETHFSCQFLKRHKTIQKSGPIKGDNWYPSDCLLNIFYSFVDPES